MRNFLVYLLPFALLASSLAGADFSAVKGYWIIPDENTNKPESVAFFYERGGLYFARMVLLYDDKSGEVCETVSSPREIAKGLGPDTKLLGLDFIFNLKPDSKSGRLKGKVVNPDSGNVFDCEVWFDSKRNALVVRGEVLIFGKNNYWKRIPADKIPKDAQIHDRDLAPNLPKSKQKRL